MKDPRSATVSNGAVNYIVQPEQVAVRGTKRMLSEKKKTKRRSVMAWFSLAKLALNAGTHIYKKRQETKMAMADAQHMHAEKWPMVSLNTRANY